jgi:ATP-dependent helicase/nuclease subunit B
VTPSYFLQAENPDPREADAMTVKMAWVRVLAEADTNSFPGMFPPGLLNADPEWATQTGDLIQRLRQTLADGALRIEDVIHKCADELPEAERWHDLLRLERAYVQVLETLDRHDPVFNRIDSAGTAPLPVPARRIVLAVLPDPSALFIQALERADADIDIDILVHAPPEMADHFDDWGRPDPETWRETIIDIPDPETNIRLAGSPADQSQGVTTLLTSGACPVGETALGVPDDAVTPFLEADLEKHGISVFDPSDQEVRNHPVFGLLQAFAALVGEGTYRDFASLLRHPDVLARVITEPCEAPDTDLSPWRLLEALDTFQNEALPIDFEDVLRAMASGRGERFPELRVAVACLEKHVAAFGQSDPESCLRGFLEDIYSVRAIRADDPDDREFETVASKCDTALRELSTLAVEPGQETQLPLRLFLQRLGEESYHRSRHESLIDLEGWVELPWNDAPQLIVTGMNEGVVPDGRVSDVFLPDSLRQRLALRDDSRRMARDAYIMNSCVQSRQASGRVIFISGKTSSAGDPLKPSRLLFRCPDEALPERAARLFGPAQGERPNTPATIAFKLDSRLPDDIPESALEITSLSVTDFRNYLDCPFRFYLAHVLNMRSLDDEKTDVDALDFGNLVHDALRQMATSEMWRCEDEGELAAYLSNCAERWVLGRYEGARALPIRIALDAAKQRLGAAARLQVQLVAEGWDIEASEMKYRETLNGIEITGKVDRLDRNRETGCLRIIDYKSSDKETSPEDAHLVSAHAGTAPYAVTSVGSKVKRWIDLQLPLYRHLVCEGKNPKERVELAYFSLPKAIGDTRLRSWGSFPDPLYDSAISCAGSVVDAIRARDFWPPAVALRRDDFEDLFFGNVPDCITKPNS